METSFMNTKNNKTSEPHRFKYDLIDKLGFKNPNKNMTLTSLSIYYTWKDVKSIYNGMIHLTYLMDRIIYLLYKIISNT